MSSERKGPVTRLVEKLTELEAADRQLQDQYLRALAEFDNYRKRVERDLELSRRVAVEAFMQDLLPVFDDFERALEAADCGNNAEAIQKGITLIMRRLQEVCRRHGLSEFSCLGQRFDPKRAEAVSFVITGEHEPNTVVQELCKGYECQGRVLRPARVVVAKPAEDKGGEREARSSEIGSGVEESKSK
ncbi:MAG: nucleotide exchange factor GrpE [candidate division WOR-3 bacterium]